MILLVHMLFGAAIGSIIKNPILAVFLAFLGHYFLDLFPHVEYLQSVESLLKKIKENKLKEVMYGIIKVFLDFCLGILIIFIFSKNQIIIYLCAFITLIPDGLTVINSLFFHPILQRHQKIHGEKVHFLKNKKIPKFWRISTQIVTITISIILLKL